jgi:hypothetical protein
MIYPSSPLLLKTVLSQYLCAISRNFRAIEKLINLVIDLVASINRQTWMNTEQKQKKQIADSRASLIVHFELLRKTNWGQFPDLINDLSGILA